MLIFHASLLFWFVALFILLMVLYTFKYPKTRMVPKALKHAWCAGLARTIALGLFCTPICLAGFWTAALVTFMILTFVFRKGTLMLIIDDLKNHRADGRGPFQHSEDCYMIGGKTATFMKKYLERKGKDPFNGS